MDFLVKEDARKWFRDIKKDLVALSGSNTPDFDIFYFCFIAGMTTKRKGDDSDTRPIVDYFPGSYKGDRSRLLIALFLVRELEYLGVTMDEKKTVRDNISKLVKPDAPNSLSDAGVQEFNRFAHGGYEALVDWFEDRPRSLEIFLRTFNKKIRDEAQRSE